MINLLQLSSVNLLQINALETDVLISPTFFITIIAGVLLALAFQFILTAISVAGGITAVGDIKKNFVKSRVEPSDSEKSGDDTFDEDYGSKTAMGVKITTAFGIWSVVTTCIALFGATALALNLNPFESGTINTVTALVIWAVFFLILFYVEAKVARTVVGNLISAATSGLRGSAEMLTSLLTPSPESKIENVIGTTVDRIRKEFDSGLNTDQLSNVLDNFLTKVDNKIPDYEDLKSDLEDIAKKSANKNTSGKWMAVQQVLTRAITENSSSDDAEKKGKAQKLKELYDSIVSSYNATSGKEEGIKNVIENFTPLEREQINEKIEQAKAFLSSSTEAELSSENLKGKMKQILDDPSLLRAFISENVKNIDRQGIIEALSSNTNLKKADLENYADSTEATIKGIVKEFDKETLDNYVRSMEAKVSNFFNNTGRQELNYALLKNDVKRMIDNPKDSLSVIEERFSSFDNDTLRAVVSNNKYIKEEHVDRVLQTITSSKNEVSDKIAQIRTRANQQIEITKRKAVIHAEHARATAASAAWWLVLSTLLSSVAAMAGSIVAL